LKEARVYKNVRPIVHKPPEVLSVFGEGMEKRIKSSWEISIDHVPVLEGIYDVYNPLIVIFPAFDITLLFKIIMSLLALLLTYDAIAGENERGTLGMILSNPVPRHQILLGKLSGSMLTLLLPISASFVAIALILQSSPSVSLSSSDWVRIGSMFAVSLIFVSFFLISGLLFSVLIRRPSEVLVTCLFFWGITVFVIPGMSSVLAARLRDIGSKNEVEAAVKEIRHKLDEKVRLFRDEHYPKELPMHSDIVSSLGYFTVNGTEHWMRYMQKVNSYEVPLRIEYAHRIWQIKENFINGLRAQRNLARILSLISPVSMYQEVISALARTDLSSFERFVERTRAYRKEVIRYLSSKTGNFSSLSYFSVATDRDVAEYTNAVLSLSYEPSEAEAWRRALDKAIGRWKYAKVEDFPPLDLDDMPVFTYKPEGISESLRKVSLNLGFLCLSCVLIFLIAYARFLRYELR